MILDISNKAFKNIFSDGKFDLPIRWDGKNFEDSLSDLFKEYIFRVCQAQSDTCHLDALFQYNTDNLDIDVACFDEKCHGHIIKQICNKLELAIKPQDFLTNDEINIDKSHGRIKNPDLLDDSDVRRAYLIW